MVQSLLLYIRLKSCMALIFILSFHILKTTVHENFFYIPVQIICATTDLPLSGLAAVKKIFFPYLVHRLCYHMNSKDVVTH